MFAACSPRRRSMMSCSRSGMRSIAGDSPLRPGPRRQCWVTRVPPSTGSRVNPHCAAGPSGPATSQANSRSRLEPRDRALALPGTDRTVLVRATKLGADRRCIMAVDPVDPLELGRELDRQVDVAHEGPDRRRIGRNDRRHLGRGVRRRIDSGSVRSSRLRFWALPGCTRTVIVCSRPPIDRLRREGQRREGRGQYRHHRTRRRRVRALPSSSSAPRRCGSPRRGGTTRSRRSPTWPPRPNRSSSPRASSRSGRGPRQCWRCRRCRSSRCRADVSSSASARAAPASWRAGTACRSASPSPQCARRSRSCAWSPRASDSSTTARSTPCRSTARGGASARWLPRSTPSRCTSRRSGRAASR